jgi:hypothetical protein
MGHAMPDFCPEPGADRLRHPAGERPKTGDSSVSDKSLFLAVGVLGVGHAMPDFCPEPGADRLQHPTGERPETAHSSVSDKSLLLGAWVRRGAIRGQRVPARRRGVWVQSPGPGKPGRVSGADAFVKEQENKSISAASKCPDSRKP